MPATESTSGARCVARKRPEKRQAPWRTRAYSTDGMRAFVSSASRNGRTQSSIVFCTSWPMISAGFGNTSKIVSCSVASSSHTLRKKRLSLGSSITVALLLLLRDDVPVVLGDEDGSDDDDDELGQASSVVSGSSRGPPKNESRQVKRRGIWRNMTTREEPPLNSKSESAMRFMRALSLWHMASWNCSIMVVSTCLA